jgi:hypothetical protein
MQILEAYCVELDEVLDIYGAKEAYFYQPEARCKRLSFLCSDALCRSINAPRVTGVNYDKSVEESEKYVQPHFKSSAKQPHAEQCVWKQRELQRESISENQGGSRLSRAKSTDVIDVFNPRTHDTRRPSFKASPALVTHENFDLEPNPHDGGKYADAGINTTTRLECLIDCWSHLDIDKRKESFITLGGQTITYYQAALNPKHLYPSQNGKRVVQGLARYSSWPKDKPTILYLNFADQCEQFPEVNAARTLSIEIPFSRIDNYRGGSLLLHKLALAERPGFYLKIYAWGELLPSPRKGYVLDVKALDNLTLKVVPRKSMSKQ